MINPVSGRIKRLNEKEFLLLFQKSVHKHIRAIFDRYPTATGVVCFENLDIGSSYAGKRTACVVGPDNTIQETDLTASHCRLGATPSQFQYPVAIWYKDFKNRYANV